MLKIALCDDTPEECRIIEEYTKEFFRDKEIDIRIDVYASMDGLIASGEEYGLYLLDVLMPGMTGIQGADCLRGRNPNPVIVFITSSLEAAVDGYRVNASGFLLKPVAEETFRETMERVTAQKLGLHKAVLPVIHDRVPVRLQLDKVVYFENRLHRVFVTLSDGRVISIGQKLSWIQKELEGNEDFLRCHQSYIVNLQYAAELEDSCFKMNGGAIVPVSRNCYKQSKHAYYRYCLK
ncbi:MAG: LytTR family DNA-binding domain-containing protein [Lachnospiraceae bacterium]|nr:LytTR family DNA-binding domain-containing protein [Lachnospiraceae bacterium]